MMANQAQVVVGNQPDLFENPRAASGLNPPRLRRSRHRIRLRAKQELALVASIEPSLEDDSVIYDIQIQFIDDDDAVSTGERIPLNIEVASFFDTITALSSHNEQHAVNHAIHYLDCLLRSLQFRVINTILQQADVNSLTPAVMVSFLGITLPAKSKLPARTHFFRQVCSILSRDWNPERAARMLNKYR